MSVSDKLLAVWLKTHNSKVHYKSRQEAQHVLRLAKKKYSASRLEVYPCRICGQFVLGSKQKKTKSKVA